MAFQANKKNFTVTDPDRQFSMETTGGGSDGRDGKALSGPGFRCTFDVYSHNRNATAEELRLRPDIAITVVYELSNLSEKIPGLTWDETYAVLTEAVLAARFNEFDDLVNRVVVIRAWR